LEPDLGLAADTGSREKGSRPRGFAAKAGANRKKPLESTGLDNPEGKATASKNAPGHGLVSSEVILVREDEKAFSEVWRRLRDDLGPLGEFESLVAPLPGRCHDPSFLPVKEAVDQDPGRSRTSAWHLLWWNVPACGSLGCWIRDL
jgi:hypothetical protein